MKSFADYLDEMQAAGEEDPIKMMIEVLAHAVMEAGVEKHLGAGRHERTEGRRGHRNGWA